MKPSPRGNGYPPEGSKLIIGSCSDCYDAKTKLEFAASVLFLLLYRAFQKLGSAAFSDSSDYAFPKEPFRISYFSLRCIVEDELMMIGEEASEAEETSKKKFYCTKDRSLVHKHRASEF